MTLKEAKKIVEASNEKSVKAIMLPSSARDPECGWGNDFIEDIEGMIRANKPLIFRITSNEAGQLISRHSTKDGWARNWWGVMKEAHLEHVMLGDGHLGLDVELMI